MYKLDFLSEAPKTLILEQNSNRSNLGGVFSLILSIIVLFIGFSFIYDYARNINYSLIYYYDEEYLNDDKLKKKLDDERYNPEITYKFEMNSKVNTSNYFVFTNQNEFINFGEERKSKIYDFYAFIGYNCEKSGENDYDCSIRESDKEPDGDNIFYLFSLNYTGTKIEHNNKEFPLQKNYNSEYYYFNFDDKIKYFIQKWKTIKYTEDKGIFGTFGNLIEKPKEYYGGVIMNDKMIIANLPEEWKNKFNKKGKKILCVIKIGYSWINYLDNYTRIKKIILEPISELCSLSLTIYNIFIFVYCRFFSNNFDNYKIIEKILSKSKRPLFNNKEKDKTVKIIKLSCNSDKKDNSSLKQLTNKKNKNLSYIISKNEISNEVFYDKKSFNEDSKILPKFSFYIFLFNNIYFKKCCSSKKQDIVSMCNNIVSKYYSIDYIVYNQIRLENLFKDYKWNEPGLNAIENNKMINELESLNI